MTDNVIVAIITGGFTLCGSLASAWFSRKSLKKSEQNAIKLNKIEEQGNGHTDQLVKLSHAAGVTEGIIKGTDDEKSRTQGIKVPAKHKKNH